MFYILQSTFNTRSFSVDQTILSFLELLNLAYLAIQMVYLTEFNSHVNRPATNDIDSNPSSFQLHNAALYKS